VNSTSPSGAIFSLVLFLAIGGAYTAVAWQTHRRWGLLGLAILWLCCSAAYGYVSLGPACRQPLACELGDPDSSFYLTHVAPVYAIVGALGFAAGSAVIHLRSRSRAADRSRATDLALGTLATLGAWIVGTLLGSRLIF